MKRKPICNTSLSGMQKERGGSILFEDEALLVQISLPPRLGCFVLILAVYGLKRQPHELLL